MWSRSMLLSLIVFIISVSITVTVDAFVPPQSSLTKRIHHVSSLLSSQSRQDDAPSSLEDEGEDCMPTIKQYRQPTTNRRKALHQSAASIATIITGLSSSTLNPQSASALPALASFSNPFAPSALKSTDNGKYIPAKRCTAYLVDSTIPPTLIPYRASREAAILKNLGMGSGTSKSPFIEEDVNLNNFMNKAVFGAIDGVKGVLGLDGGASANKKSGPNYSSFVFLGANFDDTYTASPEKNSGNVNNDATLVVGILTDICKPKERSGNTAIGLSFAPQASQGVLDEYLSSTSTLSEEDRERKLVQGMVAAGASESLTMSHLPILQFAKKKRCTLLALSPNPSDLATVQKGGLQSLDPQQRDQYVADAQGFISLTQEPKFKLYTDKSLLKDFTSTSSANDEATTKAEQGNFFAERILVHEACATAISKWATSHPDSLVVTVAPIPDVRFLGGINGRVPRICQYLNPNSLVDDEAVTTILLNPNAKETLSESKFLRLEIGTAPNNWTYQTKIADYLWFSSMPKVNMMPRMMNEQ